MSPVKVSDREFLWREWVLGEGRYKGRGPRSEPRPRSLPVDIPDPWFERLEEWLVRQGDNREPGVRPTVRNRTLAALRRRQPADPLQLTPHFHTREFKCHDGRLVPKVAIPALDRLCTALLEPMRGKFGPCHVLSGYRPRDYNARIGGATFSQHIYELTPGSVAADMTFLRGTPAQWAQYARETLKAGGVGRYDRSGFVHIDNRPVRAYWKGN